MGGLSVNLPHKLVLKIFAARNNEKYDQLISLRFQNCKFMKTNKKNKQTANQFANKTPPPSISLPLRTTPETYYYQKSYDVAVSINFIVHEMVLAIFL